MIVICIICFVNGMMADMREGMKDILSGAVADVLCSMGVVEPKVSVEYPARTDFGDFSTGVALAYAKDIGLVPKELAEKMAGELEKKQIAGVSRVEVAGPGFVNFFVTADYFGEKIAEAAGEGYGNSDFFSSKKFFIEHTQPNPFKEFHIGHLMNNTIGESISRIVRANGAEVKTASYHGDVGLQVAKAVWALLQSPDSFADAYARGHVAYEEDEGAKKEIIDINKKIYDAKDSSIQEIYEKGRKKSLDHFESIYKRLDSHFDYHFFESQSGEVGKKIVLDHIGTVFEKSDGAVVFKGENFEPKTHTRVFLNSEGLPTYEAKEVGLAKIKKDAYPYDESVTVTANEQDSFFTVVEAAIGQVFPELRGKLHHLSHGMLKLPTGKMSSRTGNIITAEHLIDDAKKKVLEKMVSREVGREMSDEKKDAVAEIVAIGAIKYSILKQAVGGDIVFDFDTSLSFEGDSGPYLQYSAVRALSVIKRAQHSTFNIQYSIPDGWQATDVERCIERYPGVVLRAGREYSPHYIATYLVELAGAFNVFYASHKIIDLEDPTSPYRIAITRSVARVLASGLQLLGVKVPDEM